MFLPTSRKIVVLDALAEICESLLSKGNKIVFTNGVFDLLHSGHVTYLEEARALGTHLVVAVNTDASVKTNKGDLRPIVNEQDRCQLLAALECVDFVVMFDSETPVPLVERLRPAIYVKGGDYLVGNLPETPVVKSYGGVVQILSLVPGRSSTDLIAKIVQAYGRNDLMA